RARTSTRIQNRRAAAAHAAGRRPTRARAIPTSSGRARPDPRRRRRRPRSTPACDGDSGRGRGCRARRASGSSGARAARRPPGPLLWRAPASGAAAACRAPPSARARALLRREHHVVVREAARVAILEEQAAVRVEHVVAGTAPEAFRHRGDALIAALDLDEHADGRFVDRHDHVLVRVLLPVFLVPEPDVEAQLLEDAEEQLAVAHDGFELVAQLHVRRLYGAFERDAALAVLGPDPQRAAAPPERLVLVVEEGVFLEPAPEHRGGARRLDRGARRLDRLEPQLDLALERRRGAHKRGI